MTDEKLKCRHWIGWAEEYLTEHPVVPLELFEAALLHQFRDEVTEVHDAPMGGKNKRDRKRNLTDHVKASLTRRDLTETVELAGQTWIVWKNSAGSIRGVGELISWEQVFLLLNSLAEHLAVLAD